LHKIEVEFKNGSLKDKNVEVLAFLEVFRQDEKSLDRQ